MHRSQGMSSEGPASESGPSSGDDPPPPAASAAAPAAGSAMQDAWQLLELAAIHYPDSLAVVDCGADRLMTYAQLHARASSAAAWLRASGVRRGDRIGLLSRNSSLVMELHFAVAALHAVIVNLNIHLAPRELAYILADSGTRLVAADRAYAGPLLAAAAELADEAQEEAGKQDRGAPGSEDSRSSSSRDSAAGLDKIIWLDVEKPAAAQLEACAAAPMQVCFRPAGRLTAVLQLPACLPAADASRDCAHDTTPSLQRRPGPMRSAWPPRRRQTPSAQRQVPPLLSLLPGSVMLSPVLSSWLLPSVLQQPADSCKCSSVSTGAGRGLRRRRLPPVLHIWHHRHAQGSAAEVRRGR